MSNLSLTTRLYAIALVTVVAVVACDRVPLTSPTGGTISISVDKGILPLNGQTTVRAVLIESSGTPVHNGTTVVFQPSIGRTDPVEAQTVNGVAVTTFIAGAISGEGVIHAFSGGIRTGSGNSSGNGGATVKIGAAAAGSVALQVVPPSVGQNGGTVTVTALVLDAGNNPLPGVPVLFSVDTGTLSNANVTSDANGYAVTNLVTTRSATVSARVGSLTPATFAVTVSVAPTVTITSNTTTPTVNQPVSFTVTPSTAANASPIQSILVDFGDGQTQVLGGVTGPVGLTHTYTNPGGYTVSARATDISGNVGFSSVSIIVARAQLPTVTLSAPGSTTTTTATSITFGGTAPTGSQFTSARVTLQDGTVIYSGTAPANFAYRFGGAGTYTLTGTVTDSNGGTASTSTQIVVNP